MKRIRLTPIDEEFEDYEDDIDAGEGLHLEFDLTPYLVTCAIACAILFVIRFVEKHFFTK